MFSPFPRKTTLQFGYVDPLDDGLREMIEGEQSDPENIAFQQELDGGSLTAFWSSVERDIHGSSVE